MDEGVEGRWSRWLEPYGDSPPLDEAAARIASEEGGNGDGVAAGLDTLAAGVGTARDPVEHLARLVQHLFVELGFRGDDEEYDHPRNSCIDQVIERRRGLPIVLSVITMEVGRRIGLPLLGIGYPGHFLVGTTTSPALYLDPFDGGRIRRTSELVADLGRRLGRDPNRTDIASSLGPTASRDILVRMSTNLFQSWLDRDRPRDALRNADRRVALRPELPELRRDRGLLRAQLGLRDAAVADLGTYLGERPDAADATRVRWQLSVLLNHQA
jgi:regulator of sirC expression with transglutaminase-like and TPR domain